MTPESNPERAVDRPRSSREPGSRPGKPGTRSGESGSRPGGTGENPGGSGGQPRGTGGHPPAAEATVGLLRAADHVRRTLAAAMEPYGITVQQYNVLRILRGAHPEPLPTLEIAERMIERTPGVTRLVDRLEGKGLIGRERSTEDRRYVLCSITLRGLALLDEIEEVVEAANDSAVAPLGPDEVERLVGLLDRIPDGSS